MPAVTDGCCISSITGPPIGCRRTAPLSARQADIGELKDGDYVQQLGIAGTNFPPTLFSWRAVLADVRLGRLLQAGIRKRNLLDRLLNGMRVPDEGTTLLVDYGLPEGDAGPEHVVKHLAGHAVYTRPEWMLFHAEETAQGTLRRFGETVRRAASRVGGRPANPVGSTQTRSNRGGGRCGPGRSAWRSPAE